jgi:hypothetical protein
MSTTILVCLLTPFIATKVRVRTAEKRASNGVSYSKWVDV